MNDTGKFCILESTPLPDRPESVRINPTKIRKAHFTLACKTQRVPNKKML